jgi:hypothetical protein
VSATAKPSSRKRVSEHRARLRALGLKPVQIWVPDTNSPAFAAEAARQSRLIAASDGNDPEMMAFLEAAWAGIDSGSES